MTGERGGGVGRRSLVLLRHGQSESNLENRFDGWDDDDLTPEGREEVRHTARLLNEAGFAFDVAFASYLRRAIRTLWIVLDEMDLMWVPTRTSWRLNERHYGALQGMGKEEAARRYGEERISRWRSSYGAGPPAILPEDPRYPGHDARYALLARDELPLAESLEDVSGRLMPYWSGVIAPAVKDGERALVAAHEHSLRALVKHLEGLSDEEVAELSIPGGCALVYELDGDLRPAHRYYLGDPD